MRLAQVCGPDRHVARACSVTQGDTMQWTTPAFEDLRFGFEITMYIAHR
jgi:coenzyme PQQ precursor peptide PqqA